MGLKIQLEENEIYIYGIAAKIYNIDVVIPKEKKVVIQDEFQHEKHLVNF